MLDINTPIDSENSSELDLALGPFASLVSQSLADQRGPVTPWDKFWSTLKQYGCDGYVKQIETQSKKLVEMFSPLHWFSLWSKYQLKMIFVLISTFCSRQSKNKVYLQIQTGLLDHYCTILFLVYLKFQSDYN